MKRLDKSASRSKSPLNRSGNYAVGSNMHTTQTSKASGNRGKPSYENDRYASYSKELNTTKGSGTKRYDSAHSSSKSPNKTSAGISRINGSSHAVGSSILKTQSKFGPSSNGAPLTRSYNYLSSFGTAFKKNLAAQNLSTDKSPSRALRKSS